MKIPVAILQDTYEPVSEQSRNSNQIQNQNQTLNRTIVYIDGQNFLHRCSESLIKSGAIVSQHELTNIDLNYIFKKLFPSDSLEIRFYGTSKASYREGLNADFSQKVKRIMADLQDTRKNFTRQGVNVRDVGRLKIRTSSPCKNCGYMENILQEKGVDVGLAIDMVEDAALGIANKIVLASSDMDMVPAIRSARRLGVRIIYAGVKGHMTKGLMAYVDEIREISNCTILEAYVSAMNFPGERKNCQKALDTSLAHRV